MQKYTRKKLRDILLTNEKRADDKFSKIGPQLIASGNVGAYGREFKEIHANALEDIVKDILESEKKALSRVTAFPRQRYYSNLKGEVLEIVNRKIQQLNEELKNILRPYSSNLIENSVLLDSVQCYMHDQIGRAVNQLQEEIRLLNMNKVKFWLEIVSLPAVIGVVDYPTGWIRPIFWSITKLCGLG